MSRPDPELLGLFAPEFAALAGRLGQAGDAAAARVPLDAMSAMADGLGLASLKAMIATAREKLDPFDADGVVTLATALARHAAAIVAAGEDLPVAGDDFTTATPASADADGPATGAIRTLIVDDSAIMRRLIREILAADPRFTVVAEAADGEAALAEARRLEPDLVLLDIEMPVLDGIGALRRLALEGGAGALVVVSSALPVGSEAAAEARRLGAAAIVGKPSGTLSLDLAERGAVLLAAARRATGVPAR